MINERPKSRILILAIIILLMTNISMLVFLLFHDGRGGKKGFHGGREAMVSEFLKKDIGFNPAQLQQYDTLSKKQHEQIGPLFDEARKNKEDQLKQLAAAGFTDSAINIAAGQSSEKQKNIETNMFRHIREIRTICTPDQLPKFDSLVYKIVGKRGDGKKKQGVKE